MEDKARKAETVLRDFMTDLIDKMDNSTDQGKDMTETMSEFRDKLKKDDRSL